MSRFLLACLLLLSLGAWGLPGDLKSELLALRQAALSDDYPLEPLGVLCNEIGPRLSGSAGAEAAVDYVAGELRHQGLKVTLEPVQVPHWVRGLERGAIVACPGQPAGVEAPLCLTALGGSVATPDQGLTAEVLVVRDFADLERQGSKARGKIVCFNVPFDQEMAAVGEGGPAYGLHVRYRVSGPSAAARLGAVACLVRSWGSANYRLPHTGNLRYAEDAPAIPSAALAAEDSMRLAWLGERGPVKVHLVLTPRTLPEVTSHNVLADLPGSEHPEQVVVVSGHLDSWDLASGALDDASGVVMAMQTAHLFQKLGLKPRRTLRVIAWMNEENGLAGARAYAKDYGQENHRAAIESDLGAGHPTGIEVMGPPALLESLAPVREALEGCGAGHLEIVRGTGADISPLAAAGVPCFHPLVDSRTYFDYHHTPADTFDKVDPVHLRENCAVMAVLAYGLAQLP